MNLMDCNRQWLTRSDEERFLSLTDMSNYLRRIRDNSSAKVVSSRQLTAVPVEGDHKGLMVQGPGGNAVSVTNWSFGQLAQRAGAPAGYLRDLPSPLAADCLNYGLAINRDVAEIGVLLQRTDAGVQLAAATGPNYGRVWSASVVSWMEQQFGDGVTGDWKIPGEFGRDVPITKKNTTLYAGDRNMFVFLADEKNRITLPNRRDGKAGSLARGFFVKNSDVGSDLLEFTGFLFDYACCNRIVWGATEVQTLKIRHTASAPDRWLEEVKPALEAYAEELHNTSESKTLSILEAAQKHKIDKVEEFLHKRFTKSQVAAIHSAHQIDEHKPIETLWDAATGITAYARNIKWQDERVAVEAIAGKVLELAN